MRGPENQDTAISTVGETLPEGINRRNFFRGAVTTFVGGMLAGCSGDGGGGQPTEENTSTSAGTEETQSTGQGSVVQKNVTFRQPWKAEPSWVTAWVAEMNGHWVDAGITPPTVQEGFGSADSARRIGTGNEAFGMADINATVPGLAEGFDVRILGFPKSRSSLGWIWRTDMMEGLDDIEGKTVVQDTSIATETWPLVLEALGVEGSAVETTFSDGSATAGLLAEGNAACVWGSIDDVSSLRGNMPDDVTLKVTPYFNYERVPGYPILVSGEWYENESNAVEYAAGVLEGYSHAQKWVLLNPEEAVTMLMEDINQQISTIPQDDLMEIMKTNFALMLSSDAQENGLCWVDEEMVSTTLDTLGQVLVDDTSSLPAADELVLTEPRDKADLATLTSDELSQVKEFSGKYMEWYES